MEVFILILMQISFSPSSNGLHTAILNVFALTALSSNVDRRQKVLLSNSDMSGCTFQSSILLKAFADQPRVQVTIKLDEKICACIWFIFKSM